MWLKYPKTKKYFFPNGQKLKSGDVLINPEYAKTLTKISKNGAKAFYNGSIAEEIVNAAKLSSIDLSLIHI